MHTYTCMCAICEESVCVMNVYTRVCMYECVFMHVHVCVKGVHVHVCVQYVKECVCLLVCVYLCMYASMFV